MAMTDPIADMLTRIRNGLTARQETVDVPSSKLKVDIAQILEKEGYIKSFSIVSKEEAQGSLDAYYARRKEEKNKPVSGKDKKLRERDEKRVLCDTIVIELKYGADKQKVLTGLKKISKPGLRVYAKADEIPSVLNGLGVAILSTSKGILTDKEARESKTGGEVLAYIW